MEKKSFLSNNKKESQIIHIALLTMMAFSVNAASLHTEEDYYVFETGVLTEYNKHIKLNTKTNAHGQIKAEGPDLIDSNGKRVHLWGIGIRLTNNLLSASDEHKAKIINYVKSLGFNHILFVGLDFDDPGFYRIWKNKNTFDKDMSRDICDLVRLTRDYGLYYSFDINHITSKYSVSKPNKHKTPHKIYKEVQIYDQLLLEQAKAWITAIMTSRMAGCETKLSDDPLNVFINIVNEDSLFNSFYKSHTNLSKNNIHDLQLLFHDFKQFNSTYKDTEVEYCVTQSRCTDTSRKASLEFLHALEESFFSTLKKTILSTGYNGIITTTNHWYGQRNNYINHKYSDAINLHIYFDHPINKNLFGKSISTIKNYPYHHRLDNIKHSFTSQIYSIFNASTADKPLMITEWNHGKWSDYSYAGPVLLYTYASIYGAQIVDAHTLLPRHEGYQARIASNPFDIATNPTNIALLPSLSFSFRNKHLDQSISMPVIYEATSEQDFLNKSDTGLEYKYINKSHNLHEQSTEPKARMLFPMEGVTKRTSQVTRTTINHLTGQDQKGMRISNPHFFSLLGYSRPVVSLDSDEITISTNSEGALTIIPIDNKPLAQSDEILLTITGGSKYTNQLVSDFTFNNHKFSVLRSVGKSPALMKRHFVTISISKDRNYQMFAIPQLDGDLIKIEPDRTSATDNIYNLGKNNTPWYLLRAVQ